MQSVVPVTPRREHETSPITSLQRLSSHEVSGSYNTTNSAWSGIVLLQARVLGCVLVDSVPVFPAYLVSYQAYQLPLVNSSALVKKR